MMEKCDKCKHVFDPEKAEQLSRLESRGEFWGAPCSEYITYGVICPKCGNRIEF